MTTRRARPISAFAGCRRRKRRRWCARVFDSVAARYDLMNDLMSAGIHRWWKAEMVAWLKPRPGQRLLDVAGGTGDIALPRAAAPCRRTRGRRRVVVCDVNQQMLEIGRARAIDRRHPRRHRVAVRRCRGAAVRRPQRSTSIRSPSACATSPGSSAALAEARRVLKPGGRFLCLEFTPAVTPLLQPLYDLYSFQVLPLLGPGRHRRPRRLRLSGREHPAVSAAGRTGRDDRRGRARSVRFRNLTGGIAALHSAWRL